MKKDYESDHSRANTPLFVLKTVLIFFCSFYFGLNALVFSLTVFPGDREMLTYGSILFAVLAAVSIISIFDNRSGMKSTAAVIIWLVIYIGSVFALYTASFSWLPVLPVAAAEIFVAAAVILILRASKKL